MKVPFTWKPTGWYQIGWSVDFPTEEVRPLRYFGNDMVAYRDVEGGLHLLEAHCPHLGAHLGHGGHVVGTCVQCPFHGWEWGPDGYNTSIPDQDRPNRSKQLRVFPVMEQYGLVFMWHHPHGEPPSWEMLDIFTCYPDFEQDPSAYYDPIPTMTDTRRGEPVHPSVVLENAADSAHFEFVHHSTIRPVVVDYTFDAHEWYFIAGWPDREDPELIRLKFHSKLFGIGGAISGFEGGTGHRVVFSTTPVETEKSDMFYTIWWLKEEGDTSTVAPPHIQERVQKEFLTTVDDDLMIWRTQKWIEHPAYSKIDAKGYTTLRKWFQQFYDVGPDE